MHLAGFFGSATASTETDIAAVSDGVLTIQSNKFQLFGDYDLLCSAAICTDIQRAKLSAPTFAPISDLWVRPVYDVALSYDYPPVANYLNRPFKLPNSENIGLSVYQDNAAAQDATGLIWISKGMMPAPGGRVYTFRGTSTTAAVSGQWTDLTMTWSNDLEGGMYAVVGGVHVSTNGRGFRLQSTQQVDRPGGLSTPNVNLPTNPIFRMGRLGQWCTFRAESIPNIQVLVDGTDASHEVYLDLVKIA
jgi:hypothetical protein